MRPSLVLLALVGCVDAAPEAAAPAGTLEISPAALSATVIDHKPIAHDFVVTLVEADGSRRDVTDEATFAIDGAGFGTWDGGALTLTGAKVGSTQVTARVGDAAITAPLFVYARTSRFAPGVPRAMRAVFDEALEDPTCGPAIAYPSAESVVPRNVGSLDVHWSDARSDVFEVQLVSTYRDVRLYTRGIDPLGLAATIPASDWKTFTDDADRIELRVSGVIQTDARRACTTRQAVRLSDRALRGVLYLWGETMGIVRHDVTAPDEPMSSIYTQETTTLQLKTQVLDIPLSCEGCALSRSGARLAVPSTDLGFGVIYDFAAHSRLVPTQSNEGRTWHSAAFTADDSRLVIAHDGELELMSDTGTRLASIASTEGTVAGDPAFSPDGRWLANVESVGLDTSLIVRRFDAGGAGDARATLVPAEKGVLLAYPTWSPDGSWLAFTRVDKAGTSDPEIAIWAVPADGTRAPAPLTQATRDVVRAHWVPEVHTSGGDPFFYLAYATTGVIGQRPTGPQQIVVQAVFTSRAGFTTTEPYRLPFQSPLGAYHLAGWSATMVR